MAVTKSTTIEPGTAVAARPDDWAEFVQTYRWFCVELAPICEAAAGAGYLPDDVQCLALPLSNGRRLSLTMTDGVSFIAPETPAPPTGRAQRLGRIGGPTT